MTPHPGQPLRALGTAGQPADHRRYRDPQFGAIAVKVLPGEHYITSSPDEMLVTILGSCVAACIRDPVAGVGGMNHFMLPESGGGEWDGVSSSMRYGNVAMERLINDLLKQGGERHRLEVKVFGGGNVLVSSAQIGDSNADFVEAYLAAEGLPIVASHLRGIQARRVHYFPHSGKVLMRELKRGEEQDIARGEQRYRSMLRATATDGSIELF
jgi:chemotaxis protein CheD